MKTIEIGDLPISLDLAKMHLRLGDDTFNDLLVEAQLEMAVAIAEDTTGRVIQEQQMEVIGVLKCVDDVIRLPVPTSEILGISYSNGSKREILSNDQYKTYFSHSESILFVDAEYVGKELTINFKCGYDSKTIPKSIKAAILLILGTLYDNESDHVVGRSVSQLNLTADKILQQWRLMPY